MNGKEKVEVKVMNKSSGGKAVEVKVVKEKVDVKIINKSSGSKVVEVN